MDPYLYIGSGVGIFLTAAAFVNLVLINQYHYSYPKNYIFFTVIYVLISFVLLSIIGLSSPLVSIANSALLVTTLVLYTLFGQYLNKTRPVGDFTAQFKIPVGQEAMLEASAGSCFVKVWEIVLQQMMAYMIFLGLMMLDIPLIAISFIFAAIVCVVHYPGLRIFGPVFGGFYFVAATIISIAYPFIVQNPEWGWGVMVFIHTAVYAVWYSYVWREMKFLKTK